MTFRGKQFTRKQFYYTYVCKECEGCKLRKKCTKSKSGRTIRISENQIFKEYYRDLMETEAAKEQAKRRKTIVEHVFGTIEYMMGYNGFKARGRQRVEDEITLYSLAYNIKRWLNITNPKKSRASVKRWCVLCRNYTFSSSFLPVWVRIRLSYADLRLILCEIMHKLTSWPKISMIQMSGRI